ncbi:peptidase M14 [Rheinheimera salexigens]|uniref:Peptidase M14 n=2 Tax=Rheinheimera salexigens TaxID=1628148 RepID=A0A1E7Q9Q1_9GAMM|nr:peptidase M14 [Rheinheimera salexigens]
MVQAMTLTPITDQQYQQYQQSGLDKPQLTYSDIAPILAEHGKNALFSFTQIGQSVQGTPIWQIDIGTGETRVLAWSQMHGDESTATAALMDFLNFIAADEQADWRQQWLSKVQLRIIPMLNPDGAAAGNRLNAMGIDINRDAKALQTPEGRLLMQAAKQFKAQFALNLHDQNRFYSVGDSDKTTTISLLAPAFNVSKDIDATRHKAMQLIGDMHDLVQQQLPGYLGKYNDTYSVRSFGDTFAGMGMSTVLIESGAYPKDDNRQVARKLNAQLLIMSVQSIGSQAYAKQSLDTYHAIPFNRSDAIKDVLVNNLTITVAKQQAQVDLALEFKSPQHAVITEVGDLCINSAYHQFDATGLSYQQGKAYKLTAALTLDNARFIELMRQGYSHFSGDAALLSQQTEFPVLVNPRGLAKQAPQRHHGATFLLANEKGVQFAMLAGQLVNLSTGQVMYPRGT